MIGLGLNPFMDYEVAGEKAVMATTKFRAIITLGAGPPTALERAVQRDLERGR